MEISQISNKELAFNFHHHIASTYSQPSRGYPLVLPYQLLSLNEETWLYHTSGRKAYITKEFYGLVYVSKNSISSPKESHTLKWDLTAEVKNFMRGNWNINNQGKHS